MSGSTVNTNHPSGHRRVDCDHAGTPKAMYSHDTGEEVWSTDHETYGKTRDTEAKYTHLITILKAEQEYRKLL
ncbi:hypothetical protein GCM10007392_36050 [Saccharospirillum salsuginis]|uniref:Uncharacterized protein n=1 Tax=Saccharospirillum salsuginis TaxID=418750 RepID=A0A918KL19_9GAMM|nr:hypothetical protein GCM10007392_36050 [Saccharospirillum salsuginis]